MARIVEVTIPGPAPRDLQADLEVVLRGMPALQRQAVRAAVWMVAVDGVRSAGKRHISALSDDEADALVARLGGSDLYAVREMVTLLKLVAGFVRELDPGFREAVGWGRGAPVQVEGVGR